MSREGKSMSFYATAEVAEALEPLLKDGVSKSKAINNLLAETIGKAQLRESLKPTIIAVGNYKGGVGKSTTTAELAFALGELGRRVLAIDMDGQGDLSLLLNAPDNEAERPSIADVMLQNDEGNRMDLLDVAVHTPMRNVDVVPANLDFVSAELKMRLQVSGAADMRLKYAIEGMTETLNERTFDWESEDEEVMAEAGPNIPAIPKARIKVRYPYDPEEEPAEDWPTPNPRQRIRERDLGNVYSAFHDKKRKRAVITLQYDTEEHARIAYARYAGYEDIDSVEVDSANDKVLDNPRQRKKIRSLFPYRERANYDYILIDCPPAVNTIMSNAVIAMGIGARNSQFIVPINPARLSIKGMNWTLSLIRSTAFDNALKQPTVTTLWTLVDESTPVTAAEMARYNKKFPDLPQFKAQIKRSNKVVEGTFVGKLVGIFSKRSNPARKYAELAREIDDTRIELIEAAKRELAETTAKTAKKTSETRAA